MYQSCLGIVLFSGLACSGGAQTPPITTNPSSETIHTPVTPPVLRSDEEADRPQPIETPPDDAASNDSELDALSDVERQSLLDQIESEQSQALLHLEEIISLYRRLHIELDDSDRSDLIIDLFKDPRTNLQMLGFELVDRDLSSSTVLKAEVGESAKELLSDANPTIRSKAARLITRLVPPDAMMVLTESLIKELDPVAAEPMLLGVARWPSPEAVDTVIKWFVHDDAPFAAACSAAWSLETRGHLDPISHHPVLLSQLKESDPKLLRQEGMKLYALLGDAADLHVLVSLLLSDDPNQQQWAANALVETPRAVEVLVQAAELNNRLFHAGSDSLVRHRATPEGLRRLVSLPYPNDETRMDAIVRMGDALDNDRLSEAVGLADLSTEQTIRLLYRLLNDQVELTPRVSKGILLLAQLQLDASRPDRAFEAAIALDDVALDLTDRAKASTLKARSLISLGRLEDALANSADPELWHSMLKEIELVDLRLRIAQTMIQTMGDELSAEQLAEIRERGGIETPDAPDATETPIDAPQTDDAEG